MKKILSSVALVGIGALLTLGIVFAQGAVTKFPDVNYKAYYGDSIDWANTNGIVNGYSNGKFGPNDAVTRAQFVAMLHRYNDNLLAGRSDVGVGDLQGLVCAGINRDSLSTSSTQWGSLKATYDKLCTSP